jgi:cytochrome c
LTQRNRALALVLSTLVVLAMAAAAAQPSPSTKQSVWDGVFTETQANRGERQYGRACERCHGADLAGDQVNEIPALSLDAFMTSWSGKSVKDLVDAVKRSMPKDKPGSLGTGAYVDVVAYLLQANRFPAGSRELPRVPEELESIVIERK